MPNTFVKNSTNSPKKVQRYADRPRKYPIHKTVHWGGVRKVQEITQRLAALGLTVEDIADIFGITRRRLNQVKAATPQMQEAFTRGKENLHDMLVAQMVLAATGYDYEDKNIKKDAKGNVKEISIFKKHQPPNAQLFMFLFTNQFAKGTERWPEGWKIKRVIDDNQNVSININAKIDTAQIRRLAGRLFDPDSNEHPRKSIVASEVVRGDSSGRGVQDSIPANVSCEAADMVQEPALDNESKSQSRL